MIIVSIYWSLFFLLRLFQKNLVFILAMFNDFFLYSGYYSSPESRIWTHRLLRRRSRGAAVLRVPLHKEDIPGPYRLNAHALAARHHLLAGSSLHTSKTNLITFGRCQHQQYQQQNRLVTHCLLNCAKYLKDRFWTYGLWKFLPILSKFTYGVQNGAIRCVQIFRLFTSVQNYLFLSRSSLIVWIHNYFFEVELIFLVLSAF